MFIIIVFLLRLKISLVSIAELTLVTLALSIFLTSYPSTPQMTLLHYFYPYSKLTLLSLIIPLTNLLLLTTIMPSTKLAAPRSLFTSPPPPSPPLHPT